MVIHEEWSLRKLTPLIDFLFLVMISLLMTGPLWESRLFYSHENVLLPFRMVELHRCISEGVFFPRWFPDYALGFGLPQLVFFPPLSLYLAEFFRLIGCNLFRAIQLAFAGGILSAAIGMYLLGSAVWGRWAGIVSAAAYIYAPYHIFNLYVRGDLHEFLALSFMPYVLWAVYRFEQQDRLRYLLAGILSYSGLILTHNLSAVLFTPALFVFCLFMVRSTENRLIFLGKVIVVIMTSYLLTLFFWGPALIEKNYVKIDVLEQGFGNFRDHFITFPQFFSTYWGYGVSARGANDTVGFQIGNAALMLAAIFIIAVFPRLWWNTKQRSVSIFCLAVLPVSIFMMTRYSTFLWDSLPLIKYFQFPYRFLALASLSSALLAGGAVLALPRRIPLVRQGGSLLIMAFILFFSIDYCNVADYYDFQPDIFTPNLVRRAENTVATGEYIPRWVPRFPPQKDIGFQIQFIPEGGFSRDEMEDRLAERIKRDKKMKLTDETQHQLGKVKITPGTIQIVDGRCSIQSQSFGCNRISAVAYALEPAVLRIGTFFFPGWKGTVNGQKVELNPENGTGLVMLAIGEGSQKIELHFGGSVIRSTCGIISIVTLLSFLAWIPYYTKRLKTEHQKARKVAREARWGISRKNA